jgi:hypothetical protein
MKRTRRWPLFLIAAPAAVAIWSGWVGLGGLCGFGPVNLLPGIGHGWTLNTAITLPVGVEAYGAYALGAWLGPGSISERARQFARKSAKGSLALGMTGQVIYHLLKAAHATRAPWPVVVGVACLPVVALGFGAALAHLLRDSESRTALRPAPAPVVTLSGSAPRSVRTAASKSDPKPALKSAARDHRGPVTVQALRARYGSQMPSKRAIKTDFGVGWDTAVALHAQLQQAAT